MKTKTKRAGNRRIQISLKPKDREALEQLTRRGRQSVRVLKRARVLQLMDEGKSAHYAAEAVGVTHAGACAIANRYIEKGLEKAVCEHRRPGHPRALTPRQEQEIVAMVCSAAPAGRARWTVKLLLEEAKKQKIVKKVERMTLYRLLANHDVKPWREKNVVRRRVDAGLHPEDGRRPQALRETTGPERTGGVPG